MRERWEGKKRSRKIGKGRGEENKRKKRKKSIVYNIIVCNL